MEIVQRQGLVVWLKSFKYVNNLRKHGYIHYSNKQKKYVILYVDKEIVDESVEQIKQYSFVKDIETSYLDDIDMSFPSVAMGNQRKDVTPTEADEDEAFFENIAKAIQVQTSEGEG